MELRELAEFSKQIQNMIGFLIRSLTTDVPNIKNKEEEYKRLSNQLSACFLKLNIPDPNPFPTLQTFYAFCRVQLKTWAERREYINGMYKQILEAINTTLKEGQPSQLIKIITEDSPSLVCKPIFKSRNFKTAKQTCFVLMPFRPNFERLYKDHIKPTIEKVGYETLKANDLYTTSPIIEDIWEQINKSKLILADVTGKNANVFYELGIAHTVGKDTIIITQNDEDVPFDLKHLRYFRYEDNEEGWKSLDNCLEKVLRDKK
ncbi:MAG TPA: hypothetical protein VI864_04300 [Candidatus Bathyarchaeia archaeon]|nr:hypothetical protein [Candidatus Bathyarchaeia archaeon]